MKNITRTAGSAALCALAAAACTQTPGPQASPFSSTTQSIEAALQSGCLPYLVEGGGIIERLNGHSARGGKLKDRPAARMYGSGDVQIQEDDTGGCYLRAVGAMPNTGVADAARFRQAVLDFLPRVAGPLTTRSDSGPGFNDEVGRYRQESYCFVLSGKPAWVVLSTSAVVNQKAVMQVSVGLDRESICDPARTRSSASSAA